MPAPLLRQKQSCAAAREHLEVLPVQPLRGPTEGQCHPGLLALVSSAVEMASVEGHHLPASDSQR